MVLNHVSAELWPFALVGLYMRPLDIWATIRGEAPRARMGGLAWLTLDDYLRERLRAAQDEDAAADQAAGVASEFFVAREATPTSSSHLNSVSVKPAAVQFGINPFDPTQPPCRSLR